MSSTEAPAVGETERDGDGRDGLPLIGETGAPVRALAFSSGGYSTTFQLGAIHALLVSRGKAPDVVVGISAGAVTAVAVAEVLQAKEPERLARFRTILEAYRAAPRELLNALTPDAYQVTSQRPLRPQPLPIHAEAEREDRAASVRARAGLIRLANDALRLRITVGTAARFVRAWLGIRAVKGQANAHAWFMCMIDLFRMWRLLDNNAFAVAPQFYRILQALTLREAPRKDSKTGADVPPYFFDWWNPFGWFDRFGMEGRTAGDLIFKGRWRHAIALGLRYTVGLTAVIGTLLVGLVLLPFIAAALVWPSKRGAGGAAVYVRRFFELYDIADGLCDLHPVREMLIRVFDPNYYGRVPLDVVVERAIDPSRPAPAATPASAAARKRLCDYATAARPIRVGAIAADVKTGQNRVLPSDTPVVDALLGAVAVPPFFEPVQIKGDYYVDGITVATEPNRALLEYLKPRVNRNSSALHLYPVVTLPLSKPNLPNGHGEYTKLVDVAFRAKDLERFRDATLDRRMTELYTESLPPGAIAWPPQAADPFLRTFVYPVEPEAPVGLNRGFLFAKDDGEARALALGAVAAGCRAALEVMIPADIAKAADGQPTVSCRKAIRIRLGDGGVPLPASAAAAGATDGTPGLPEICQACALHRGEGRDGSGNGLPPACQELRVRKQKPPSWPLEGQPEAAETGTQLQPEETAEDTEYNKRVRGALAELSKLKGTAEPWPRKRGGVTDETRPTVSLLFSGGVFRGVYLTGVLNALSELGVQPDLMAGSSVGSITAAMSAAVLTLDKGTARDAAMARLAAIFLGLDRIVLTDRLSDFVRSLTLRAAGSDFSLADADQVFRVYDRGREGTFDQTVRRVVAGIERLTYVSPFELIDLVKAFRLQHHGKVVDLLRTYAQEFLSRGAVGLELLGAEPLRRLIEDRVLSSLLSGGASGKSATDALLARGIHFLCTATNLTEGRLEILGAQPHGSPSLATDFVEMLLASSAFPAVFRPRWGWEVLPRTDRADQYIDGGVMDNLPLDAVAHFLDEASQAKVVARRPQGKSGPVPHLALTASLEVDPAPIADDRLSETVRSWIAVKRQTARFGYNKKLEAYARMQRDLRTIWTQAGGARGRFNPVDLEVVAVKPNWLCGTFEFHPMLGFRASRQAESIAHGCASTFAHLSSILRRDPSQADWFREWGIQTADLYADLKPSTMRPRAQVPVKEGAPAKGGQCWFRKEAVCPFSTARLDPTLEPATSRALAGIHQACGVAGTHQRRD